MVAEALEGIRIDEEMIRDQAEYCDIDLSKEALLAVAKILRQDTDFLSARQHAVNRAIMKSLILNK